MDTTLRLFPLTFRQHPIMHQYRPQNNPQQANHRDPTGRPSITLLPVNQRSAIDAISLSARWCGRVDACIRAFE